MKEEIVIALSKLRGFLYFKYVEVHKVRSTTR